MSDIRRIKLTLKSRPTLEGAGVRLKRAFGYVDSSLDPFLLLDDFHSDNPDDYMAGFPWHPHRGIETITYMIEGKLEHGDSMGNKGIIHSGDVQWMTAGSGIVHQEMPKQEEGLMWGFQLWANLPSSHKMMDPRYRDLKAENIPIIYLNDDNVKIKIICGTVEGVNGPVEDIITEPEYLDIEIQPGTQFIRNIPKDHNVFAYTIAGEGYFDHKKLELVKKETLVLFKEGERVKIRSGEEPLRLLLISGKPIKEPVAWRGPIVMNTRQELAIAFQEYQNGNFIKHQ